jgi:hypothetical protein
MPAQDPCKPTDAAGTETSFRMRPTLEEQFASGRGSLPDQRRVLADPTAVTGRPASSGHDWCSCTDAQRCVGPWRRYAERPDESILLSLLSSSATAAFPSARLKKMRLPLDDKHSLSDLCFIPNARRAGRSVELLLRPSSLMSSLSGQLSPDGRKRSTTARAVDGAIRNRQAISRPATSPEKCQTQNVAHLAHGHPSGNNRVVAAALPSISAPTPTHQSRPFSTTIWIVTPCKSAPPRSGDSEVQEAAREQGRTVCFMTNRTTSRQS